MKLTRKQADVLFVVRENGPATAGEVAYHLPITESAARSCLVRLWNRGCVDATYTNLRAGRTGRGFVYRKGLTDDE